MIGYFSREDHGGYDSEFLKEELQKASKNLKKKNMSIKAKFVVQSIQDFGTYKVVDMNPVISGSEENKSFSMYTPSGKISLTITNPEAFNQFEPTKEYYITFEKAE